MQRADESTGGQARGADEPTRMSTEDTSGTATGRRGNPPVAVFLVLLGAIVLIAGLVVATREEDRAKLSLPKETPVSEQEAIAEFTRLSNAAVEAVQSRSLGLVSQIFTSTGSSREVAMREIHRLIKNDVIDRTQFELVNMEVLSIERDEIEILETSRLEPCFLTEDGSDVTRGPKVIEQQGRWTLKLEDGQWRVHQVILQDEDVVDDRNASCDA